MEGDASTASVKGDGSHTASVKGDCSHGSGTDSLGALEGGDTTIPFPLLFTTPGSASCKYQQFWSYWHQPFRAKKRQLSFPLPLKPPLPSALPPPALLTAESPLSIDSMFSMSSAASSSSKRFSPSPGLDSAPSCRYQQFEYLHKPFLKKAHGSSIFRLGIMPSPSPLPLPFAIVLECDAKEPHSPSGCANGHKSPFVQVPAKKYLHGVPDGFETERTFSILMHSIPFLQNTFPSHSFGPSFSSAEVPRSIPHLLHINTGSPGSGSLPVSVCSLASRSTACGLPFLSNNENVTVSPGLKPAILPLCSQTSLPHNGNSSGDRIKPKPFSSKNTVIMPVWRTPSPASESPCENGQFRPFLHPFTRKYLQIVCFLVSGRSPLPPPQLPLPPWSV
mmetsp:Transcript_12466/g.20469  ORF Transcript_12466/g.20469 Transcript_12466/m.20469 type:complete len:391 (+) Transcript_12466:139-1311(+)